MLEGMTMRQDTIVCNVENIIRNIGHWTSENTDKQRNYRENNCWRWRVVVHTKHGQTLHHVSLTTSHVQKSKIQVNIQISLSKFLSFLRTHRDVLNRIPLAAPNVDIATNTGITHQMFGITISAHVFTKKTPNKFTNLG